MISACGFHLRGTLQQSTDKTVFVRANYSPLTTTLRRQLSDRKIPAAADTRVADIVVRLENESRERRVLSVANTGYVNEYELIYSVDLAVLHAAAERAQSEAEATEAAAASASGESGSTGSEFQRVTATREYTYQASDALGKDIEAEILWAELEQELANHIISRMIASERALEDAALSN